MNRWKASATHLLLSILVIGGIALTAYLLWFPMGLYPLSGLDRILLIMLGIDLTAGPLLTLVVYRPGKKGLKLDLAVIAICQLAFLGYGLHALAQARPAFLLGMPDRFTLVFANDLRADALANARNMEWRKVSWTGPQLAGARMPTDPDQRSEVMEAFMTGGPGLEHSPRWYQPYSALVPAIIENAQPLDAGPPIPEKDIRALSVPREHLRWHPIYSRFGEGRMLIDARDGTPLHVVPL